MADARYAPSRHCALAGAVALALAGLSAWIGLSWAPAFLPAGLFLLASLVLLLFAFQAPIEISAAELKVGNRTVAWQDIRRIDSTGWVSPLLLYLTLQDGSRLLLVYPGDLKRTNDLLHRLRRRSRSAMIDGVPYQQFFGDSPYPTPRQIAPAPRYRVLPPEEELEVEQLFHRLKSVGHLDPKNATDEQ